MINCGVSTPAPTSHAMKRLIPTNATSTVLLCSNSRISLVVVVCSARGSAGRGVSNNHTIATSVMTAKMGNIVRQSPNVSDRYDAIGDASINDRLRATCPTVRYPVIFCGGASVANSGLTATCNTVLPIPISANAAK